MMLSPGAAHLLFDYLTGSSRKALIKNLTLRLGVCKINPGTMSYESIDTSRLRSNRTGFVF